MLRYYRSTDATIPASDTEVGTDAPSASSSHNTPHFEGEFSGTQRGSRGFGPACRGPFVSAKGPKTMGARAGPQGGAFAPVPTVRAAELASLRQSSPPNKGRDRGAATPAGALEMAA